MYIINETYFNGVFNIPNSDELNTDTGKNLELIIDDKARLFLQEALGYELFIDLDQYVINGVFDDSTAPQKWIDFVNGKEYVINNNTYKWQGLIYENGGFKKSILADFCYYHWLIEKVSTMHGVGDVVVMAKNAINVNPTQRIVTVWNDFVFKNQHKADLFNNKTISYVRGVKFTDYYNSNNNNRYISLVKYLEDNKEDYPNVNPRYYETQNQLGL